MKKRTKHAREITERFRELIENSGDTLPDNHYSELTLLIEAGLETMLVETLEQIADKLDEFSRDVRHNAEFFE